jgi:hypothetical protein
MLEYLQTIGRVTLTLIIVFKLTQLRYTINAAERMGLGFMGAGSFLTISVIWERQRSPFDGWACLLLTFGAIAFIAGRTWRDLKHQRANKQQVKYWEAHKAGKRGI